MSDILIVDDMAIFREPVAAALGRKGYSTRTAKDGLDALEQLKANRPDLVLLDISMPKMNGLEVLSAIRNESATRSLPVIMLTDAADKSHIIKAGELGIEGYVLKSAFSLDDLLTRIKAAIPSCESTANSDDLPTPVPGSAATTQEASEDEQPSTQAETPLLDPNADAQSLQDCKPIIKRSEIQQLLDDCGELKGLSPAVAEVLSLTQQKNCSMEAVAKAIKKDHGVSLKLLRLANSSVYDRGEPVDSIQKAIMRMGLNAVRQAVLNLSVVERFNSSDDERISPPQFWEHSIATGLIAAEITKALEGTDEDIDSAFTMGLLHDAGRMVYAEMLGERYKQVLDTAERLSLPIEQVESRLLLINHADAMDRVLHAWRFPKHLVNPIAFHHLSVGNIRRMSSKTVAESVVLALANRLAHALLLGHSGNIAIYPIAEYIQALRLDPTVIQQLEAKVPDQTADMKFAMLARSSGEGWPQLKTLLRKQLPQPFRPLFIGNDPDINPFRMACDQLQDQSEEEPPNIAVVHVSRPRDQSKLSVQLVQKEKDTGVGALPTLVIAPNDDVKFDESEANTARATRIVSYPVTILTLQSMMATLLPAHQKAA